MRYQYMSYRLALSAKPPESWRVIVEPPRWQPTADMFETSSELILMVELPGVDDEKLEILLFENALVVQGRREPPSLPGDAVFHAAEIRRGPFRLEVSIPPDIAQELVRASLDRGVLTVRLPRPPQG